MTINYSENLPASDHVDVRALARLFNEVTNSYKFLFFLALLGICERRFFHEPATITMDEVLTEMLVLAWYPHVYFRLSFGRQDKMTRELDCMPVSSLDRNKLAPWNREELRSRITVSGTSRTLLRYVPFRLLRPFFPEIKPADDHSVGRLVKEAAATYFVERKPVYMLSDDERALTLHPDWLTYFKENLCFIRAWAQWHYLQYMQKMNPMVPGLATKLFPPEQRESLNEQTKFWDLVVANGDVRCVYSGERIQPRQFDLDHFLPWSFVAHNELWNLIPVSDKANSSKSDRLPDERYIDEFVRAQRRALLVTRGRLPEKKWVDQVGVYPVRLNLTSKDWLDSETFLPAYKELLMTQLTMANMNGFERGWIFRG